MIPTTLSANTPTGSNNSLNGSGNTNSQQNGVSTSTKEMVIGIASLILEGRAFAEDEFQLLSLHQNASTPPRGPNSDSETLNLSTPMSSSSSSSLFLHSTMGTGMMHGGGRQSPKPSTSKAASSLAHSFNLAMNSYPIGRTASRPLYIETPTSYHSSSSAASSAESTHQRWTQKLCQLRQASPAASLTAPYEQKVAVEAAAPSSSGEPELVLLAIHDPSTAGERGVGSGDYEIVRRMMLSRTMMPANVAPVTPSVCNSGSASSSPSSASDNFLHSLQSLATTCLRGNSPSLDTPSTYNYSPATNEFYASTISSKYAAYRATTPASASSSGSGVQSPRLALAMTTHKEISLKRQTTNTTRRCTPTSTITSCSAGSASTAAAAAATITTNLLNSTATKAAASSSSVGAAAAVISTNKTTSSSISSPSTSSSSTSNPQQGPHCDQFLRKMGLAKGETAEAEDHYCDMSYVNITCSRWKAYCLKMEAIIERGEPICIEVYLGPASHKVLLEQWIITYKEKVPPPTMTLPSLCSAIRSQLYFSQISAWCDLIRKSDKSIYDTGRVVFPSASTSGCAGDLATFTAPTTNMCSTPTNSIINTSGNTNSNSSSSNSSNISLTANSSTTTTTTIITPPPPIITTTTTSVNITPSSSPNTASSSSLTWDQLANAMLNRQPRLNVFYRIKLYEATACFNSKPTIHNFPNVNISENCSISVCLKSLPRINGGIPKIGAMMPVPGENFATHAQTTTTTTRNHAAVTVSKFLIDETPRSSRQLGKAPLSSSPISSLSTPITKLMPAAATAIATATTTAAAVATETTTSIPATTTTILTTTIATANNSATSSHAAATGSAATISNCDNRKIHADTVGGVYGSVSSNNNANNPNSNNNNSTNFNRYKYNCQQIAAAAAAAVAAASATVNNSNSNCLQHESKSTNKIISRGDSSGGSARGSGCGGSSKAKCMFFIDESELNTGEEADLDVDVDVEVDDADIDADVDADDADADDISDGMNDTHCSNGSCGSLSHREKQLLKYRKRMLKRDKKQHLRKSAASSASDGESIASSICISSSNQIESSASGSGGVGVGQCQPMEQGDDGDEDESEQSSVQTLETARHVIRMISTGTQTLATGCCQQCGSEKSLICLRCLRNNSSSGAVSEEEMQQQDGIMDEMDACSLNSLSSNEIINTPRSKADLLLQAIQRTPKAAKHKKQTSRSFGFLNSANSAPVIGTKATRTNVNSMSQNNNHLSSSGGSCNTTAAIIGVSPSSSSSSLASLSSGCQVCKRQKTQHNFAFVGGNGEHVAVAAGGNITAANSACSLNDSNEGECESSDDRDGGKVNTSLTLIFNHSNINEDSPPTTTKTLTPRPPTEIMDEECFVSSTKLTPHFDRCALSSARSTCSNVTMIQVPSSSSTSHSKCQNNTANNYQKRSCTPSPVPLVVNVDCEFKTPTATSTTTTTPASAPSTSCQHNALSCKATTTTNSSGSGSSNAMNVPKPPPLPLSLQFQEHKPTTSKPNLLQVAGTYHPEEHNRTCCGGGANCTNNFAINGLNTQSFNTLLGRKNLPKVNLTPIFCNPGNGNGNSTGCCNGNIGCTVVNNHHNPSLTVSASTSSSDSSSSAFPFDAVTISRVKYERAAAAMAQMCTANNQNNNNNNININSNNNNNNINTATTFDNNGAVPVQKSYSAPTLPNSPSLSPRFAKQAAIYKRRSRHLSDRSDRSSLGSDEQFSDEELECGSGTMVNGILYSSGGSGATSPMKQRSRFAALFSRQPLLGNLEECLLQKRITPKTEVNGFKVQLGASGGFCPTQLTIPAAAYFYELHGETLSTPYLCEIRLPRKGYAVPRTGTIQATLLNPLGTVVRMFVIPYDMRDMPPLHQTFIRQRILADTSAFGPTKTVSTAMQTGEENGSCSMSEANDINTDETNFNIGDNQNSNAERGVGPSNDDRNLGHFISAEHMKRLRYSIHLRFQTSRSGRLMLHSDIRLLISRRTDCDTAAAHAKGLLEAPNELITDTVMPSNPKYSVRQDIASIGSGSSRI